MIHSISNGTISVSVNEEGSELWSLKSGDGIEYLWQGNGKYWADRAPTLFPFVGRLKNGKYTAFGREFSMPIHGIAPYEPFSCLEKSADTLVLELRDTPETLRMYPWHFSFRTEYRLEKNILNITYTVENLDECPMYFGLGGHPGFNVPIDEKGLFEDYTLEFEAECEPRRVVFDSACLVAGREKMPPLENGHALPLYHGMFDGDALVMSGTSHAVTLKSRNGGPYITVRYPGMPYIGVWHMPHTDAPYVCLEPWCTLPASAEGTSAFEKMGLLELKPKEHYVNQWSIEAGY